MDQSDTYPTGLLHIEYGDIVGLTKDQIARRMEHDKILLALEMDANKLESMAADFAESVEEMAIDNLLDKSSTTSEELSSLMRDMDLVEKACEPPSSGQQERWALEKFQTTMDSLNVVVDIETCSEERLAACVRVAYGSIRRTDGGYYAPATLRCFRAGLYRFVLRSRGWDILSGQMFKRANDMLKIAARLFLENGGEVKRFSAVEDEDQRKIRDYFDRSTPGKLQHEFYYNMMSHFGLRAREWLRRLTIDSFEELTTADGREAVKLRPMGTKADGGHLETAAKNTKQVMMVATGLPDCPVACFKQYMEKIATAKHLEGVKSGAVFLRPRAKPTSNSWYFGKQAVGHNTLGTMMQTISEKAGLSRRYTPHCIRATVVTELHNAGFSLEDIGHVTGHRSVVSTQRYIRYSKKKESRLSNISDAISRSGQCTNADGNAVLAANCLTGSSLATSSSTGSFSGANGLTASSVATSSSTGGFSGEFSGCTFNIYYK